MVTESSVVKFKVLDKNGNVVANQNVKFALNTTVGGVKIDPLQATTDNSGIVQTVVTTGTVATFFTSDCNGRQWCSSSSIESV